MLRQIMDIEPKRVLTFAISIETLLREQIQDIPQNIAGTKILNSVPNPFRVFTEIKPLL